MNSAGTSKHIISFSCETCGQVIDFQKATEAHILRAIDSISRRAGKATTVAIATEMHLSESQIRRYLTRMEASGRVQRIGERGGWQRAMWIF